MKKQVRNIERSGVIIGTIVITGKGIGFVRPSEKIPGIESIEVSPAFLNTALNGDTVEVYANSKPKAGKEITGEITRIISRSKHGFAGVLQIENGTYFISPDDQKMYADILISEKNLNGAKPGDKVFAKITSWKDPRKSPEGEIAEILGKPGENEAEMRSIALEKGFDSGFPEKVEGEAEDIKRKGITDKDILGRKDFRKILTFTIDPEDAKDFDDAISFESLGKGEYEVGVHIADVSHYVTKGSELDKEAEKRGTSVYLVDRTIPMLPEILSNDLCSLKPDVDRLAMSAVFTINESGGIKNEWFGKTVIRSQKRFTYEEAEKSIHQKDSPLHKELSILNKIAKKMTADRFSNGAISLDQEEVKFVLDKDGKPIGIKKKSRGDSNKLIEEFMLLANKLVAEKISKGNEKNIFVYRVHDSPNPEKMQDLVFFLKSLGYKIPIKNGVIPSKEINALLESLSGKEEKGTIHKAVIRSMAKAVYSTQNIGHYGLAFKFYTHFTSPIRRYPDVIVHRLLYDYSMGKKIGREKWSEYESISIKSSLREKEAADAERSSIKYKQTEFMSSRIGEIFDGVISGVTEWGLFVEEKETKCEGLIRIRDLGNDFYIFDDKKLELKGKKTGKKYRLGEKVKVKVIGANVEKKMIDYQLIQK